jgi:peptidoglycan/LPS O-acetylase OafA/YrhL
VLNPDIRLQPNPFSSLCNLPADKSIGAVAPLVVGPDGRAFNQAHARFRSLGFGQAGVLDADVKVGAPMVVVEKNSLDLLRLVAATMVLYSHQYVLLGSPDPSFLGWTTFGGAGVTIFFFLSGMLVWSSWDRDADWRRFFHRRSLRIFPALWVTVLLAVFLLGPFASSLRWQDYFGASQTWRYFTTAFLANQHNLPGVFLENAYPGVVNGSLWTLPVEFLCYVSVALVGSFRRAPKEVMIAVNLLIVVALTSFGPLLTGARFSPHFEMIAVFWWGVWYGYCVQGPRHVKRDSRLAWALAALAFLGFALLGERGFERMAMLVCAASLVHIARRFAAGARLTDPVGDLSYGMYIFAFPVQQLVAYWGRGQSWSWAAHFGLSLMGTSLLAYASWHLVESRALRYKPKTEGPLKVPAA